MATNAADPTEQDTNSSAVTLDHKRPHNVVSRDDASNAGSTQSTPRKRARYAGKLGHQDVRDFVPVGASFSMSSVPVDEADDSSDDGSQAETSLMAEKVGDQVLFKTSESVVAEGEKALVEGRRLITSPRNHHNRSVKIEDRIEGNQTLGEISEVTSPQGVKAAPPVNWNAVNTTKIRTTFGDSVARVKNLVDEPDLANGGRKEAEGHTARDLTTSVALERLEGLRVRLSAMNPHDGPISVYKSAQQELHDAEVDYNYCLYFPVDEAFQPPPLSTARKFAPKEQDSREYRLRMWSMVEQCMNEGTLQDLGVGKIRVRSAERLGRPTPGQESALESSDGSEQSNGQTDLQTSTVTDPEQIRILDYREARRKQYGYLQGFLNTDLGSQSHAKMEKRVHEIQIHLNYCHYFPTTEEYMPLALAKKGLNELSSSKTDCIRAPERRAAQIWKLVEQCTQDGNLQELKDGGLAAWLNDAPPPKQSFLASALQARHPQEFANSRGNNSNSQPGGMSKEISKAEGVAFAEVKPTSTPKKDGESHARQGDSESDGRVILNLDYENQDKPSEIEKQDARTDIESGDRPEEILSDVDDQHIKQKLPATDPVDVDLYASDSVAASNSDTESNDSNMDSESQPEDGDIIMQHSNSAQSSAEAEGNEKTIAVPSSHNARFLADLSSQDLNAQLRYFHTTKAREEVDKSTPVRCLVCAKEGHVARLCEFLTCSTCGAFNQHTVQGCPNKAKCGKCREQGHDEGHCPYKLKRMPRHEIVCDLCHRNGHVEEDCELIWRTSGRPWESDLARANVRLSCYECGHSGHLGNDCSSRKPNKSMGTSTWDGNMGPVSIESSREIKIKGKATQQYPINLDGSDDDRANFYRPKISVPEPVRKGQIRIVTSKRESPVYESTRNDRQAYADHRHGSFTPVNESYRNGEARQPYQQYQDGGRGNWRAVDGPDYATGHKDIRHNKYRPSERPLRSPTYRERGGYGGGSSWQPSRPAPQAEHQDKRPPANTNIYRPMPSAAQNAWTRRRV